MRLLLMDFKTTDDRGLAAADAVVVIVVFAVVAVVAVVVVVVAVVFADV